jgi:SAM-dependent methyltransferase
MTEPSSRVGWPTLADRQANFDRVYATQPERFAGPPSRFCEWVVPLLGEPRPGATLLDLGCGVGRDARRLAGVGFTVRATDNSGVAIERASADPTNPPSLSFARADAVRALRESATGSLDVVYAHALYMMLSDEDLAAVVVEAHRALRPGGLHAFGVRSTTDPMAGQGIEVAPDTWVRPGSRLGGASESVPYRYFRPTSIDALTAQGFERVRAELAEDVHFWFVLDRRA